jgi:hypothetical protein
MKYNYTLNSIEHYSTSGSETFIKDKQSGHLLFKVSNIMDIMDLKFICVITHNNSSALAITKFFCYETQVICFYI